MTKNEIYKRAKKKPLLKKNSNGQFFFLFYRLSQSTKLHPRVLITSIAKTQRGKFSRVSSLLACTPVVVHDNNGDNVLAGLYYLLDGIFTTFAS